MKEISVLLHNVRSSHNVGSIFRTADAAGISKIILSGYTPSPLDRFGRSQKEIAKTALGAELNISWEYIADPAPLMSRLKIAGWKLVGVEQDSRSKNFRGFRAGDKTLYVFGNEVRGLSKGMRNRCDVLLEIPMRGALLRQKSHPRHSGKGKESLNVAVSVGIVLFSALNT